MSYEQIKMSRRKLLIGINSGNNKITFSFAYLLIQNLYFCCKVKVLFQEFTVHIWTDVHTYLSYLFSTGVYKQCFLSAITRHNK